MKDVQNQKPRHEIPINRVGIRDLEYPITVLDRENKNQATVGKFTMSVDLPYNFRGTHMSRFVAVLNKYRGEVTYHQVREILLDMKRTFEAERADLACEFAYFIDKKAPVSGENSLLPVKCSFVGEIIENDEFIFNLKVNVPIMTLCPCSKEISEYGAHNQRAQAIIEIRFSDFVWIEELVEIAESAASAPIYSLLKRPDEKYITELSYNNPNFVEDVVRIIAVSLNKDKRILEYNIEVISEESIHTHNAFAVIKRG